MKSNFELSQYIFGFDPALDSLKAKSIMDTYSPVNYLRRGIPPVLMIHGTDDQLVPVVQSMDLHTAFDSLRIDNEIHILEGVDHGFIFATDEQMKMIQDWIYGFVKKHTPEH